MTEVIFSGRGEWFTNDSNGLKLAIKRYTTNPYQDPNDFCPVNNWCPDYDDWLGFQEDTDETFTEWVEVFEESKSKRPIREFVDKEHEYCTGVRGIFTRDPNVKGSIYNTDGLRSLGVNYLSCPDVKAGVFKLTDDDEEIYQLTNKWKKVKKGIKTLLPSDHVRSYFLKLVNEGKLSIDDMNKCYFKIQHEHCFNLGGKSKPIKYKPTFILLESKRPENIKKSDRLKDFIGWLKIQVIANGVDGFNTQEIDCTKEELFKALKDWEKTNYKKNNCVWQIKGWGSAGNFWTSGVRKDICDIHSKHRAGKNKGDYEHIFKKIKMPCFL